jgi:AmmeMemoRadiSam system protein A
MTTLTAPPRLPPEVDLTVDEEERLLALACLAVQAATRGEPELAFHAAAERVGGRPAAQVRRGAAFVTLLEGGELRGCIGTLDPSRPLAESVAQAAVGAVLHDWRFPPVTPAELPNIEVEVSVLGPVVELEDPLGFRVGIDGLIVQRGSDRGLLLPEVATEHRLDAEAMLEATCRKAGLAPTAWREPDTRVLAFRTRRFGGPAIARAD